MVLASTENECALEMALEVGFSSAYAFQLECY